MKQKYTDLIIGLVLFFIALIFILVLYYVNSNENIAINCINHNQTYINYGYGLIKFNYCGDIDKIIELVNKVKEIK